jgi:hypothetical protein
MGATSLEIATLLHVVALSLWGGVVATEAVIEISPFRRHELHAATIRMHYWIDLLVELPLVIAVVLTGGTLLYLTEEITPAHLIKVVFAGAAVSVNLFCIAVVLRRYRRLGEWQDSALWRASRIVLACFVVGLGCAAVAAVLGFRLGLARLS